jgi:iron complex transport system substrate-binding protein
MPVHRIFLFLSLLLVFSCCESGKNHTGNISGSFEENFQNIEAEYAKGFTLSKWNGITRITAQNPWQGAKKISYHYYLVEKSIIPPPQIDSSQIIFVPIESIVCLSTTHIGFIESIGELGKITGIAGSQYVSSSLLNERVKNGLVRDVGYDQGLNYEALVKMKPDVVMVYGVGFENSSYVNKLKDLGFKVVFNAEYLEETPLAKAEWIKYVATLFQKDELANDLFKSIQEEYDSLTQIASYAENRPGVLINMPWKGTWYMAGGHSFFSRMIQDAGGKYLWEENESIESFPIDIENVFRRAVQADIWINTGAANTLKDIIAEDNRLKSLPPFKNKKVFNNNARLNTYGGNDYWERGIMEPHVILRDLIHIFHPDLLPDHELVYYKQLR